MKAIEYRRGQLHIQNRDTLAAAVCECYNIMQSDFKKDPPLYSAFSL
jgi:hypothetical protein